LKGLNLGVSDVLGTWFETPCDPRVTDEIKTAWFLPWGSSKDVVSDGRLVGIFIGAAFSGEDTDNPSGITIGDLVDVLETKGFTNRPRDASDGGPITIGAAVGVEETDITIGAPVDMVETEGFTNRPGDSLDGGPTTGLPNPSGITSGRCGRDRRFHKPSWGLLRL
jgi:hypothetical protein